jgi:hypothetical protein
MKTSTKVCWECDRVSKASGDDGCFQASSPRAVFDELADMPSPRAHMGHLL